MTARQPQVDVSSGFKRTAKVARLGQRVGYLSARGKKTQASEELVAGMYELGGVYVKFLQILSNLLPSFPGLADDIKNTVYDKSPYENIDIRTRLSAHLAKNEQERLSNITVEPIATGSFAQVYQATLDQQTEVVIKILRPHAKRQLKTDLRLLGVLARAAQPLVRSDMVSTVRLYKDYKVTALREVDYVNEVKNADLMAEVYADNQQVVIPKTYHELCSTEIIVQEKLEGLPLSDVMRDNVSGQDQPQEMVRSLVGSSLINQFSELTYACLSTGLTSNYTYGDPHPGNIILMLSDKVGIIDFGVVLPRFIEPHAAYAVLQDHHQANLHKNVDPARHILTIFNWYNPRTFKALRRIDEELKSIDILSEFTEVLRNMAGPRIKNLKATLDSRGGMPVQQILEALNGETKGNRMALMAHEPTARLARAHSQLWNTAKQLNIEFEVSSIVHTKLNDFFTKNPDALGPKPESMSFSEATQILTDWFTELVERDPLLFGGLFAKIRKTLQDYERTKANA